MQVFHPSVSQLKKFPHMSPPEIDVWLHFLQLWPDRFKNLKYDVRVGKGITPIPGLAANLNLDWKMLTQKRIDAVAFHPDAVYIIEVKTTATISAPGQALGYAILFKQTYKPTLKIKPVLIYHFASPDVLDIADNLHVITIHVPFTHEGFTSHPKS